MQLIQHQKLQPPGGLDNGSIQLVLPRHQQFEHHEVGQDDIGRVLADAFALVLIFLTRITGISHRSAGGICAIGTKKLLQLVPLTVGQGIHRVDDDRLDAPSVTLLFLS